MRKPVLLALSLAFLVSAQSALAAGDAGNFGTPIKSGVSVSFPDSSATFQPTPEALELLADARNAAIIYDWRRQRRRSVRPGCCRRRPR